MSSNVDPKTIEKRDEKIEEAIAEVIVEMGLKKLPLPCERIPRWR